MITQAMRVHLLTFSTAILAIVVAGCGGGGNGGGSGQDQQGVAISISPKAASLTVMSENSCVCGTQQFQATVTGGNTNAVDWLVSGIPGGNSSIGTISSSGLYTPPDEVPANPVTVSARSLANTSKTDSATITLKYPPAGGLIIPSKIKQGSNSVSVTVSGGPFSKFATASLNGTPLNVSNVSQTSMTVTIPASATVEENTLSIAVQNPAPGGGGAASKLYVVAGAFSSLPDMNTPRTGHTATLLQNGKVLITGGSDGSGVVLNSAELFDPATSTFQTAGSMTQARTRHSATLLADGTVLIAGGFGGSGDTSLPRLSAEIYDPASNTFTAVPNVMNFPQSIFAARLDNGKVLLQYGDADVYEPVTNTFAAVSSNDDVHSTFIGLSPPDRPDVRFCPGLVVLPNATTLVLAGQPYRFDSSTLAYVPLLDSTQVFQAGYGCAFAVLKTGEIFTSGGEFGLRSITPPPSVVTVWNPDSLAFTDSASFDFPQPVTGQIDVVLANGDVLMLTPAVSPQAYIYDPARKGMIFHGPDPLPLTPNPGPAVIGTPTATLLNDGHVLIVGLKAQVYVP